MAATAVFPQKKEFHDDMDDSIALTPILSNQVNSSTPASRPKNAWADNICDNTNNCYPSFFCANCVCCGVYLGAQMAHKLRMINFWTVMYLFIPYFIVALVLQIVYSDQFYIMQLMVFVFALVLSLFIRARIVAIDNINGNNQFRECCIGFWCMPCSVAQMARHLYGYKKCLDGDADPERPDNYGSYNDLEIV